MMTQCFDEATLNAFVDGEFAEDAAQKISLHLASCEQCAEAAREIESEMQMFASAFECESPIVVPSEILRARIEAKIADNTTLASADNLIASNAPVHEQKSFARWREILAGFVMDFKFTPQFAAACALIVVGFITFAAWRMSRQEAPQIATKINSPGGSTDNARNEGTATPANNPIIMQQAINAPPIPQIIGNSSRQIRSQTPVRFRNANYTKKHSDETELRQSESEFLPGEQSYVEAISYLKRAIETHGKDSLSPQVRVEYERNLALIDRAVLETRQAVRRNPHSADARDFMLAAYQSKIDLLSNVAEQTQIETASVR